MKRFFDISMSIAGCFLLCLPMCVIAILVKITSKGPAFYWSERVGRNNDTFQMPKFRTMRIDTPVVATHLLKNPNQFLTPVGNLLRKSSLDELPQLLSILKGDMSFVGPRPALFNQYDLIKLRTKNGVHSLLPGLTGWAQINGRDDMTIGLKVEYDTYYLIHRSFVLDMIILFRTFYKMLTRDGIRH